MSAARRLDVVGWVVAGVAVTVATVAWYDGRDIGAVPARPAIGPAGAVVRVAPDTVAAAARTVVETDPFRFDRRPTAVSYRPELEGVAPPPKPPTPVLGLVGLVGSGRSRWAAVLDGMPGRAGPTLVHAGDTVAGLRVRRIGPDTVIVTGADTTWRLTVRRTWP